ncbi:MAG: hypothetical protein P0Y53_17455 [Candidatus Pseudobacter hemicellulosilyticus]|uniref:Uncharacterized protein n=1 Tax=Candidatus Pseudobacter hemicellulosilyticus TaxID=3121375 RepID=A0AAJ5WP26_9BACT|nr:MAG: hypothetical protein P0Y53_17455 [Pseudobacter sp.]
MKKVFLISSLFLFWACSSRFELKYLKHKESYNQALICLLQKYNIVFPTGLDSVATIEQKDLAKFSLCSSLDTLFAGDSLLYIDMERDSTVAFCSNFHGGMFSKQSIIVFLTDESKLSKKLTRNVQFKRKYSNGWFELERIVSLAD